MSLAQNENLWILQVSKLHLRATRALEITSMHTVSQNSPSFASPVKDSGRSIPVKMFVINLLNTPIISMMTVQQKETGKLSDTK